MSDVDYVEINNILGNSIPEWRFRLAKDSAITYYSGEAPNRFHRWMQQMLLGIIWEHVDG